MLKLKNVCKSYKVGKTDKTILDGITLDFQKGELVFILGASGSGKTTLLNIIAGNTTCDRGEIYLDNRCISDFTDKELNNYRSYIVGNIFQDYNLIEYMSVYDNITLGYKNGLSRNEIDELMRQLDIYDRRKTIVNKLSGGEKQRVAIARALVNDPDILLADEPTGALDSKTGIEVMEILKRISKHKLVIVVSHDSYLANKYASRIINIKDGKCNYLPITNNELISTKEINKKFSKIKTLMLAIKNLWLKKTRTLFMALAISLGMICIGIVVNLYSNFNDEINKLEEDIVSIFPVTVRNGNYDITDNKIRQVNDRIAIKRKESYIHTNKIKQSYVDYLNGINEIKYMTYGYDISLPLISDSYKTIDNTYFKAIPSREYINTNYDFLYGKNIANKYEILIKVDSNNNVSSELLNYFDIDSDINYNDIVGRKIKIILNDTYYIKSGKYYIINNNVEELYSKSNIELTIVGVVKEKEENDKNNYLFYDSDLINYIININSNSEIVKSQIKCEDNVLGLNILKNDMLAYLGYNALPSEINIYVDSVNNKDKLIKKLDEYNKNNDKLIYIDSMASSIEIVREFVTIISGILIIFSIISIIVSSLMVAILTSVRVLERKKEIGILRSLGASKKDIRKLFNTENILIGLLALCLSLIIIALISKPINIIMNNYLGLENIFLVKYILLILVLTVNVLIIKFFGGIPARKASGMDIVTCIYNR